MAAFTDFGEDFEDTRYAPTRSLRALIRLDYQRRFQCDPGLAWFIPQNDRPLRVMDLRNVVLDTGTLPGLRSQITVVASASPYVRSVAVTTLARRGEGLRCELDVDPLVGSRLRVALQADGVTLVVTSEET